MGSVFRKVTTRPIPAGAKVAQQADGQLIAKWKNRAGRSTSAPIATTDDGRQIIRQESGTYFAKFRDHDGTVCVVPTGCRDESAAKQVLRNLERGAERIKAGIITPGEDAISKHLSEPIEGQLADYLDRLNAVPMHVANTRRYLARLIADCRWTRLADLRRDDLERWLADQARQGRSARSRNTHRAAAVAFCNWLVKVKRMNVNPFDGVPLADERADRRRQRRALTEDEITRLLEVARQRPILDAKTVRRGARAGQPIRTLRKEVQARLEALGRQRARFTGPSS